MNCRIVLVGIGGQGILFAGRTIGETAMSLGHGVIGSETHGMSQRGGFVISHLKIGRFNGPLIAEGSADIMFGFSFEETLKNLSFLKPGGACIFNKSADAEMPYSISEYIEKKSIKADGFDAFKIAFELGGPKSANLVLLGAATILRDFPLTIDQLKETVRKISPPKFLESNLNALDAGAREMSLMITA